MGGRLIRRWIGQPLLDKTILQQRQQVISELLAHTLIQAKLAEGLKKTGDIERLINRVRQRIATPRDLVALVSGLRAATEIRTCLPDTAEPDGPSVNSESDGQSINSEPHRPSVNSEPHRPSV